MNALNLPLTKEAPRIAKALLTVLKDKNLEFTPELQDVAILGKKLYVTNRYIAYRVGLHEFVEAEGIELEGYRMSYGQIVTLAKLRTNNVQGYLVPDESTRTLTLHLYDGTVMSGAMVYSGEYPAEGVVRLFPDPEKLEEVGPLLFPMEALNVLLATGKAFKASSMGVRERGVKGGVCLVQYVGDDVPASFEVIVAPLRWW